MQGFTCNVVDLGEQSNDQKNKLEQVINNINKGLNTFNLAALGNVNQLNSYDQSRDIYNKINDNEIRNKMNDIISNTTKCSAYQGGYELQWNNIPNDNKMNKNNINNIIENSETLQIDEKIYEIGKTSYTCGIVTYRCSCNKHQIYQEEYQQEREIFYNNKTKWCQCYTNCTCNQHCDCNKACECNRNWIVTEYEPIGYCSCNTYCSECQSDCRCNSQETTCQSFTFTPGSCSCNSHITSCLCENHHRTGVCGCNTHTQCPINFYCDCNEDCSCNPYCTCNLQCDCEQVHELVPGIHVCGCDGVCTCEANVDSCSCDTVECWGVSQTCDCENEGQCSNDKICSNHCMCQNNCSCNQHCYADGCTCNLHCNCETNCSEKLRNFGG